MKASVVEERERKTKGQGDEKTKRRREARRRAQGKKKPGFSAEICGFSSAYICENFFLLLQM
jgi:hypothetical protein